MEGPGSSRPFSAIRDMGSSSFVEAVRKRWAPLLLGALGLAIALTLFTYVRDDIERDALLRFERQAGDAKHIIERRLYAYVGVTYGLGALFGSNDAIGRAEFHRYVAALDLQRN